MNPNALALFLNLSMGLDAVMLETVAARLGNPKRYLQEYKHHLELQSIYDHRLAAETDPKMQEEYFSCLTMAWTWSINWLRLDYAFREYSHWQFTGNPEARVKCWLYLKTIQQEVRRRFGVNGEKMFFLGYLPHLERQPGSTVKITPKSYIYK